MTELNSSQEELSTEWQRPDWTKPEEYPDPEISPLTQWAWEFLRRNPDYQQDYNQYLSPIAQDKHKQIYVFLRAFSNYLYLKHEYPNKQVDDPREHFDLSMRMDCIFVDPKPLDGETVGKWLDRTGGAWNKLSMSSVEIYKKWIGETGKAPNPSDDNGWEKRQGLPIRFDMESRIRVFETSKETNQESEKLTHDLMLSHMETKNKLTEEEKLHELLKLDHNHNHNEEIPFKEIKYTPKGFNELLLKFDLSIPIKPQLNIAKQTLECKQKEFKIYGGDLYNTKIPLTKFRSYLQVLDAKLLGKSDKEIARQLLPHITNTYHSDYLGNKNISNFHIAAKLLRDKTYRLIPLKPTK